MIVSLDQRGEAAPSWAASLSSSNKSLAGVVHHHHSKQQCLWVRTWVRMWVRTWARTWTRTWTRTWVLLQLAESLESDIGIHHRFYYSLH